MSVLQDAEPGELVPKAKRKPRAKKAKLKKEDEQVEAAAIKAEDDADPEFSLKEAEGKGKAKKKPRAKKAKAKKQSAGEQRGAINADGSVAEIEGAPKKPRQSRRKVDPNAFSKARGSIQHHPSSSPL